MAVCWRPTRIKSSHHHACGGSRPTVLLLSYHELSPYEELADLGFRQTAIDDDGVAGVIAGGNGGITVAPLSTAEF